MAKLLKITPRGTAIYPHIHKADVYTDENGVQGPPTFKVDLSCDEAAAAKLTDELQAMLDAELENADEDKYEEVYIDEDVTPFYTEDGKTTFKFKLNENGENKKTGDVWKNKPNIYDSKGVLIEKCPQVGNGSVLKVSFTPYTWTMPASKGKGKAKKSILRVGISLRLQGVQIIKLEQFSGATAERMGFGVEEEGFEYEQNEFSAQEPEGTPQAAVSANSDDDDDDF